MSRRDERAGCWPADRRWWLGRRRFGALLLAALLVAGCAPAGPPAAGLTYVALGASDAVGVGANDPDREGWVPRLGGALGPATRVINLGVSGSTLAQALQEQLEPALAAQPDVVTVWLAVNDLLGGVDLERYQADLDRLLARLATTRARVLVGNVPDLAAAGIRGRGDPRRLSAEITRWNAAIAATVDRHGARLVDLYAHGRELVERPELIAADGFHPSAAGYARLAQIFAEAYERAKS